MRRALLSVGAVATAVAAVTAPTAARLAASRSWPPFVLVAGLLLVGAVAQGDGVFVRLASATDRLGGGGVVLLLALLALVALVTAVLNLDTAVAFLTPVLVLSARRRGMEEAPFLFGALFMANAASLLLPGSNLTNLLVLAREPVSGAVFAARMLPAWSAAVVVTPLVVVVRYRSSLTGPNSEGAGGQEFAGSGLIGAGAGVLAGALVLVLRSPAVPVLGVGVGAVGVRLRQHRMRGADVAATVDTAVLAGLFGLAVALGALAATWSGPARLLASAGRWETAGMGALAAVVLNNLPAAVLLSARAPAHPGALLIGLDLGPNLAVTGSLSALLWFHAAQAVGARPSLATVTKIGLVLVPCSVAAALLASAALAPGRL